MAVIFERILDFITSCFILKFPIFINVVATKNNNEFIDYIYNFIDTDGIAFICTRDLSWPQHNIKIQELLKNKARRSQLVVCMKEPTSFSQELKTDGATLYYYGNLDWEPMTRFTIINFGRADAILTIGSQVKGNEHIWKHKKYRIGDHCFNLVNDYAKFLRKNLTEDLI